LCLVTALTRLPGFHAKLTAGPETNQTQPSKGFKRKFGDHAGMFALFQDFLMHATYDNEDDGNEGDNHDKEDKDNEDGNIDISWIEHWVDQPAGERGCKHTET